jgi:hypothetical protein
MRKEHLHNVGFYSKVAYTNVLILNLLINYLLSTILRRELMSALKWHCSDISLFYTCFYILAGSSISGFLDAPRGWGLYRFVTCLSTNSYDQDLCPLLDLFKYLLLDQLLYMRPYDVENKASRSSQVRAWADSLVSFNKWELFLSLATYL